MHDRGSILVGLLWAMALLSVLVVGVLHTSRMDLLTVKNYGDRLQAHYLALAGVERAKALIYHDYLTRRQAGKNHTGELYNDSKDFENFSLGRGTARVFRHGRSDEGGGMIYGIGDEESRLNINTAFAGELTNINGLTEPMANSIVAWRSDVGQAAQGAGSDYYAGLQPPYVPRHGPFQSVGELAMVRDITPDLLNGNSVNQNDVMDSGGDEGENVTVAGDDGWAAILTATSTEKNEDASGKARINIQNADESDLSSISGISSDIARAIVQYRGKTQLQSIADLMDVTNSSPGASSNPLIDDQLFMQIADQVSISDDTDVAGMINVNTASEEVLQCLPGMDRTLTEAIINYRKSNGFFANIGELLRVPGMTHDLFKPIAPLITARSETFRITCEGRVRSSHVRQRIQAVVHVASHQMITLFYRENL